MHPFYLPEKTLQGTYAWRSVLIQIGQQPIQTLSQNPPFLQSKQHQQKTDHFFNNR